MKVEVNVDNTFRTQKSSETSASETESPEWLSKDFFATFLRNYCNDQHLLVRNVVVTPATVKGANFFSLINRVKIQFSDSQKNERSLSLIMKSELAGKIACEILTEFEVFKNEIDFYKRISPRINELLNKLDEKSQLLPDTVGVCEKNKVILIEDMSLKQYRPVAPQLGFDMCAEKMLLRKLASFHAGNAILHQEQPDFFENFKYGLLSGASDKFDTMFLTQYDVCVETISQWPEFVEHADKMRRFRSRLMEAGKRAFSPDPKHSNTLNHGDMWIGNVLLKFSESDDASDLIENMVFIDFQYSHWTSPAIDLQYVLNTSLKEELRTNHIDELIEFYHKHLAEFLKRLDYREHIPDLEEFRQQFMEKSLYGFVSACLIQPIFLNENNANADFEAVALDEERSMEYKRLMFSSAKVQSNLRKLIPFFVGSGVFD